MTTRFSKFLAPTVALLVLGGTAALGTNAVAQSKSSRSKKSATSQKKTSAKKSSSKSKSKSSKSKKSSASGNRLPAHYGQVELKDEQREEIYGIQNDYRSRIEKLEKQLADLKSKMNKEMEGVLTRTQKSKLNSLRKGSTKSKSKSGSSKTKSRSSRSKKK